MLTIEQRPIPSPGLHPNIRNVSYFQDYTGALPDNNTSSGFHLQQST
jgi:hypothetical protein